MKKQASAATAVTASTGTLPHEGSQEELDGDGEADHHDDELRGFEDTRFPGHPPPVPVRIDGVAADDRERDGDRDAAPPPRLAPARVAGKRLEGISRLGIGEGELRLSRAAPGLSAIWPSDPLFSAANATTLLRQPVGFGQPSSTQSATVA